VSIQRNKLGNITGSTGKFSKQGIKDLHSLYNDIKVAETNWNSYKSEIGKK
jgi:hypothetical protein